MNVPPSLHRAGTSPSEDIIGEPRRATLDLGHYLTALRAAAEPTRLRLLALCARGELTVSELTQILGQSQPRVSRHLKLMVDAGLLERFREGTSAFYRLARDTEQAAAAMAVVAMVPRDDPVILGDGERLAATKAEREAAAAAYFRKNAARWDEIRKLHVDDGEVAAAMLAALGDRPVRSLLDIGTGTAWVLQVLGPRVGRALGIDRSREMLAVARSNLARSGLANCQVRLGDMYSLAVEGEPFDLVTIHQVLHYAERPGAVIAQAARVVAPGGRLVVVDFAPHELEHLRTGHAHRRLGFAGGEIEAWCRGAGLAPTPAPAIDLPGGPLTVRIWLAERPSAAAKARARRAREDAR